MADDDLPTELTKEGSRRTAGFRQLPRVDPAPHEERPGAMTAQELRDQFDNAWLGKPASFVTGISLADSSGPGAGLSMGGSGE